MSTARIWFDGACEPYNPCGHGTCGFVATVGEETVATERGQIGEGGGITDNVAEYTAITEALKYVGHELDAETIYIQGGPQFVISRMTRQYIVNSQNLIPRLARGWGNCRHPQLRRLQWVPREQNEAADALSEGAYDGRAFADRLERVHGGHGHAVFVVPRRGTGPVREWRRDSQSHPAGERPHRR